MVTVTLNFLMFKVYLSRKRSWLTIDSIFDDSYYASSTKIPTILPLLGLIKKGVKSSMFQLFYPVPLNFPQKSNSALFRHHCSLSSAVHSLFKPELHHHLYQPYSSYSAFLRLFKLFTSRSKIVSISTLQHHDSLSQLSSVIYSLPASLSPYFNHLLSVCYFILLFSPSFFYVLFVDSRNRFSYSSRWYASFSMPCHVYRILYPIYLFDLCFFFSLAKRTMCYNSVTSGRREFSVQVLIVTLPIFFSIKLLKADLHHFISKIHRNYSFRFQFKGSLQKYGPNSLKLDILCLRKILKKFISSLYKTFRIINFGCGGAMTRARVCLERNSIMKGFFCCSSSTEIVLQESVYMQSCKRRNFRILQSKERGGGLAVFMVEWFEIIIQKGEFLICDSKQTSFVNLKKYFEHLLAFTYITFELEMVSKTQLSIFENSILFITSHSVILPTNFDKMNAVKRLGFLAVDLKQFLEKKLSDYLIFFDYYSSTPCLCSLFVQNGASSTSTNAKLFFVAGHAVHLSGFSIELLPSHGRLGSLNQREDLDHINSLHPREKSMLKKILETFALACFLFLPCTMDSVLPILDSEDPHFIHVLDLLEF
ncbi:hypothetical protein VP01_899g1 [Puccinia sorghi]|uniref:Uncharacterized protein n=1 Tax=Puccinia sorghi TaxID=27349 RepID=A0A0L6U9Z4_9BASI|nr:hypothetical protein VP01_899g1 [Puccinia sorghi]